MQNLDISPAILGLVPIVMALTSLIKNYIGSRWAPLVALGLSLVGAFLFPAATLAVTVISGVVVGLTAAGLYSGVKATVSQETV